MRRRSLGTFLSLHVLAPLAAGIAIYLLWRTSALRVFGWIDMAGLAEPLARLRALAAPVGRALPTWARYSLPDGLWVYAVTSFMCRVWERGPSGRRALWISAGPAMAIGWEMAQLVKLAPGTFDALDLVWCAVAAGAAIAAHGPARFAPRTGEARG
jgi:hypothetical protein